MFPLTCGRRAATSAPAAVLAAILLAACGDADTGSASEPVGQVTSPAAETKDTVDGCIAALEKVFDDPDAPKLEGMPLACDDLSERQQETALQKVLDSMVADLESELDTLDPQERKQFDDFVRKGLTESLLEALRESQKS